MFVKHEARNAGRVHCVRDRCAHKLRPPWAPVYMRDASKEISQRDTTASGATTNTRRVAFHASRIADALDYISIMVIVNLSGEGRRGGGGGEGR